MTRPVIAVLDYGIGNLHSAQKALEHEGADARLTADEGLIADAAGVVLPGVGAFGACMDSLRAAGLEGPAHEAAASGRPFLGICVGMQMLFTKSEEDEQAAGLDVIPGTVRGSRPGRRFPRCSGTDSTRRPTTRCSPVSATSRSCTSCTRCTAFPTIPTMVGATVEYGTTLNAAFRRGNVFAAQFHPEKSSGPGLRMLSNFVDVCAREGR